MATVTSHMTLRLLPRDGSSYTPNLLVNTDQPLTITAPASTDKAENAYVWASLKFDGGSLTVKTGEKYTFSVEGLEVLAGEPDKFTVYLYDGTGYANTYVFTKDKPYVTMTVIKDGTLSLMILYAGYAGKTNGNSIRYTRFKLERGENDNPVWTPAASEMVADKVTVAANGDLSLNGIKQLNVLPVLTSDGKISVNGGTPVSIKGPQGDKGETGDKGDKGDKGATGDKGADGKTFRPSFNASTGTLTFAASTDTSSVSLNDIATKTELAEKADASHVGLRWHYGTTAANTTGYYKITINSKTNWMLCFTIKMFQYYGSYDILVAGYRRHDSNYRWYGNSARAISGTAAYPVTFGYDDDDKYWVAVPAHRYTGLEISNVVNGFRQVVMNKDLFTIEYMAELTGTAQETVTTSLPLPTSKFTIAEINNLSGTFSDGKIPSLAASKITSGTFATDRIPSLAASKITSGTLSADRIPTLAQSKVDGLTAELNSKLATATFNQAIVTKLDTAQFERDKTELQDAIGTKAEKKDVETRFDGMQDYVDDQISTCVPDTEFKWGNLKERPTTVAALGLSDLSIQSGTIKIGTSTLTPLTQHQDLSACTTLNDMGDGVNLALSTRTYADWTIGSYGELVEGGYGDFTVLRNKTLNTVSSQLAYINTGCPVEKGGRYTLSFWARSTEADSGVVFSMASANIVKALASSGLGESGSPVGAAARINAFRVAIGTEWKRCWLTFEVISVPTNPGVGMDVTGIRPTAARIEVCGIKLERGSSASEWSAAPSDTDKPMTLAQLQTENATLRQQLTELQTTIHTNVVHDLIVRTSLNSVVFHDIRTSVTGVIYEQSPNGPLDGKENLLIWLTSSKRFVIYNTAANKYLTAIAANGSSIPGVQFATGTFKVIPLQGWFYYRQTSKGFIDPSGYYTWDGTDFNFNDAST